LKYLAKLRSIHVCIFLLIAVLPIIAESPISAPFSPEATRAFGVSIAWLTVTKGENLQRIASVAYGDRLYWPFVWALNSDAIPDPEIVSTGVAVKVARLAETAEGGIDAAVVSTALDEAYRLVYARYRSLEKRTPGERRWVLSQAVEAGVDVRLWGEAILGPDTRWAASLIPHRDIASIAPSAQAEAISTAAAVSGARSAPASKDEQESFLRDVVQGAPLPVLDIERFVARLPEGELGAFAGRLEAELSGTTAPQVAFALALVYGRMGLKAKEYTTLVKAVELTSRRPDVMFHVLVVHGRLTLIKLSAEWSDIERQLAASGNVTTEQVSPVDIVSAEVDSTEPDPEVRTRRYLDISTGSPRAYYAVQLIEEDDGFRETSRGYDDDALAFHDASSDDNFRIVRYGYQREDQDTDIVATLSNNTIRVNGRYMGIAVSQSYPTGGNDWVVDPLLYFEALAKKGVTSKNFVMLLVDQPGGIQVITYQVKRTNRERLVLGKEHRDAWKYHWGIVGLGSLIWPGADFWFDTATGDFLKGILPILGKGKFTYIEER